MNHLNDINKHTLIVVSSNIEIVNVKYSRVLNISKHTEIPEIK
jgi:hypothetical protein